LGELVQAGFPVLKGFCVSTESYQAFLVSYSEGEALNGKYNGRESPTGSLPACIDRNRRRASTHCSSPRRGRDQPPNSDHEGEQNHGVHWTTSSVGFADIQRLSIIWTAFFLL
jgi:hypothetical protein